jgi:hypothetical protein
VLKCTKRTHAGRLQLASALSVLMASCSIYGRATRVAGVWPGQRLGAAGRRGHGRRRVGLPGASRVERAELERSCRLLLDFSALTAKSATHKASRRRWANLPVHLPSRVAGHDEHVSIFAHVARRRSLYRTFLHRCEDWRTHRRTTASITMDLALDHL